VGHLQATGIEAEHVGDVGLSTADDSEILDYARREGAVVVTLDADFHALLAMSGAAGPSAIRIRIEGMKGEALARLLVDAIGRCRDEIEAGALVTITPHRLRLRRLPLAR
jgi:predicted nuclease of predicted toxin-antitoxin system